MINIVSNENIKQFIIILFISVYVFLNKRVYFYEINEVMILNS